MNTQTTFDRFADQDTVLLTTYRRDGTPVGTPVHLVVDGDHAWFRTYDHAWKYKRLMRNPEVEVAPSTLRGQPTGPALHATAHVVDGNDARTAARALGQRHPILHGWLIPWFHRLRGWRTVHFRVDPAPLASRETMEMSRHTT
jgi:PPOX class probable F420-dependent enzyme